MPDSQSNPDTALKRVLREMESVDSLGAHARTVRQWRRTLQSLHETPPSATPASTPPSITMQFPEVLATLEREGWDLVCLRKPRLVHDPLKPNAMEIQPGWWEVLAPAETGHRARTVGCGTSIEKAVQSAVAGLFSEPPEDEAPYEDEDPLSDLQRSARGPDLS